MNFYVVTLMGVDEHVIIEETENFYFAAGAMQGDLDCGYHKSSENVFTNKGEALRYYCQITIDYANNVKRR